MQIAVVIPAYNEAKTVAAVVKAAFACPEITEVLVVDDGSTDATAEVARAAGAKVISQPNAGKGGAVRTGFKSTAAEVIVLLDADLIGLTADHIRALLDPVRRGQVAMTVGIFRSGRFLTYLAQKIAPQLSGQRAIRREVLAAISDLALTRFGVEVALTRYVRETGLSTTDVYLADLTHVMKEEKMGFLPGFLARLRMYWDIVRNYR